MSDPSLQNPGRRCKELLDSSGSLGSSLVQGYKLLEEIFQNIEKDPKLSNKKYHIEKLNNAHQFFVTISTASIYLEDELKQLLSTLEAKK